MSTRDRNSRDDGFRRVTDTNVAPDPPVVNRRKLKEMLAEAMANTAKLPVPPGTVDRST